MKVRYVVAAVVFAIAALLGTALHAGESAGPTCRAFDGHPDPACTPGVTDPRVTQDTLSETICKSGYTATVRPSVEYTNKLKREQMAAYGLLGSPADFEEDHLVPLEAGGSPTDPRNLWPEPISAARLKDAAETRVHRAICDGHMTLAEGQAVFLKGTWEAYTR